MARKQIKARASMCGVLRALCGASCVAGKAGLMQATAIPSFRGFCPTTAAPRSLPQRKLVARCRSAAAVQASIVAEPAKLEVRSLDGAVVGSTQLALKVADEETQKGLVHRYLVLVQQNARRVSGRP